MIVEAACLVSGFSVVFLASWADRLAGLGILGLISLLVLLWILNLWPSGVIKKDNFIPLSYLFMYSMKYGICIYDKDKCLVCRCEEIMYCIGVVHTDHALCDRVFWHTRKFFICVFISFVNNLIILQTFEKKKNVICCILCYC